MIRFSSDSNVTGEHSFRLPSALISRCSDRTRSPHARLDLEAIHLPRPPRAAGRNRPQGARAPARDACAVEMGSVGARGARGLWAGSLGAARGRGADPIRVFRAPIGTASTHRATLGWHGSARTTRTPSRDFLPGLAVGATYAARLPRQPATPPAASTAARPA
jgi:hypothetical protein